MSGHSVCSHSSSQSSTRAAPPVVVVIRKRFAARRRDDAVVEHHAVLLAHQAVAAPADRELAPGVGVDAVEELDGVRALRCRSCRGSRRRACRRLSRTALHSRLTASCMVFAGLAESTRAASTGRHPRTPRRCPRASRAAAVRRSGIEEVAALMAGQQRRTSRACRAAGRWWCRPCGMSRAERCASDGERVDVAGLPWSVPKPSGGVALDVLDGREALAAREQRCRRRSTSFWRSTKSLALAALDTARTRRDARSARAVEGSRSVPLRRLERRKLEAGSPRALALPPRSSFARGTRRERCRAALAPPATLDIRQAVPSGTKAGDGRRPSASRPLRVREEMQHRRIPAAGDAGSRRSRGRRPGR